MAELIQQDLSFADTAPARAEGAAVVTASPAEVWAVLADHDRWPSWFAGVSRCRGTSTPASGVGSTREVVLSGGARFQERFIAWEEGALWAFTATEMTPPAFRSLVERVTIEAVDADRTRVTYRMAIDPKPFLKPVMPVVTKAISRRLTSAMGSLGREAAARR